MKTIHILLVVSAVFCCSCVTGVEYCAKVGGEHKGVQGDFELCWNKVRSNELNHTILNGENGEENVVITKEEATQIVNALQEKADGKEEKGVGVKSMSPPGDPIKELCKLLNKK